MGETAEALKLWAAPDVLAMLERQGWIEWELVEEHKQRCGPYSRSLMEVGSEPAPIFALRYSSGHFRTRVVRQSFACRISNGWIVQRDITLALLRDDSLKKIRAAGFSLREEWDRPGLYRVTRRSETEEGAWKTVRGRDRPLIGLSYDHALIAARKALATPKEPEE